MENQVTQLKLNVTNIKRSLFSSNKQLKKLKTDKKNLFFKLEKKKELRAEETRLETPRLGIGSGFSKIMSAVTSPIRSIFDRILPFLWHRYIDTPHDVFFLYPSSNPYFVGLFTLLCSILI